MTIIKLQSSDGVIFDTDVQIVKCSGAIKSLLEESGTQDGNNAVIPIPSVNSAILCKILHWANYHKDDAQPPEDDKNKNKRTDDICSWDADFLKVDQSTLLELISAAHYLDIRGLLDVTSKTLANMINGKSLEEIRRTFTIKNDLTPAKDELIHQEKSCEK